MMLSFFEQKQVLFSFFYKCRGGASPKNPLFLDKSNVKLRNYPISYLLKHLAFTIRSKTIFT